MTMEPIWVILAILLGALLGGLSGWWIGRSAGGRSATEKDSQIAVLKNSLETTGKQLELERQKKEEQSSLLVEESRRASALDASFQTARQQWEKEQKERERLTRALTEESNRATALTTSLEAQAKSMLEKQALLEEAEKKLREAFQALSAEALKSNNQAFLELAQTKLGEFHKGATADLEARQKAIDELLKPVQTSLEHVGKTLTEVEKARTDAYAELRTQVSGLAQTQLSLQKETANLVTALRAPSVRGRWGEIQLKRVVEMAGMLNYCDFAEQQSANTDDGRLRPDMVVNLPGGKTIVVDAKAPLGAYLDALEAPDDNVKLARLGDHSRQVRDHMTKLAAKSYWSQFTPTPEFVLMFLPGEMFFSAALEQDPGLIEFGVQERVIVASPTTLISLLRAVAYGWQQEAIAENAQAISELGRELYERLRVFAGHMNSVGRSLEAATGNYNKAVGSLESRVLVSARKFKELQATTGEDLENGRLVENAPRSLQAIEADLLPDQTAESPPDAP